MRVLALALVLVLPAAAGEYAVLSSGFRLRIDRHEVQGDNVVLYMSTGSARVPAVQVVAFEEDDSVPPPASPAAVPSPAPPATATAAKGAAAAAAAARQSIERAVQRQRLPREVVHLARSVAEVESGLQQSAVSPKGAIGVMQLMPHTAAALRADPRDAEQNVDAGVRYLRDMLVKYQGYGDQQVARALAAYNAGPGAVDRYHGVPPYPETQRYVRKVIDKYRQAQEQEQEQQPGPEAQR